MRFVSWLWEQMEDPGDVASFAKLCWDDVNNGCASPRFTAHEWIVHFEKTHKDKSDILTERLILTYAEFIRDTKGKFAL